MKCLIQHVQALVFGTANLDQVVAGNVAYGKPHSHWCGKETYPHQQEQTEKLKH